MEDDTDIINQIKFIANKHSHSGAIIILDEYSDYMMANPENLNQNLHICMNYLLKEKRIMLVL